MHYLSIMDTGIIPLSFTGVRLLEPTQIFRSEPQWQWQTTIPGYYNLWFAISGRGELTCNGERTDIRAGTGLIFGPGQHINAWHDPEYPIVNFAAHFIPQNKMRDTLSIPELPLRATKPTDPGLFAEIARTAVACGRIGDGLAIQQESTLVYQLVTMLWRSHKSPPLDPIDADILSHIEDLRTQPAYRRSIPELAAAANLSCSQYSRRFTGLAGCPPNRFMMQCRINRACMLLRDSPLSIEQIAQALEYQDPFFFSRQFKRVMGVSPASYRKSLHE
jgi:AraC family transcriptional regulator of arabinose operon